MALRATSMEQEYVQPIFLTNKYSKIGAEDKSPCDELDLLFPYRGSYGTNCKPFHYIRYLTSSFSYLCGNIYFQTSWAENTVQNIKKKGMNANEYIMKIRSLSDKLAAIGEPLSFKDQLVYILNGLGP